MYDEIVGYRTNDRRQLIKGHVDMYVPNSKTPIPMNPIYPAPPCFIEKTRKNMTIRSIYKGHPGTVKTNNGDISNKIFKTQNARCVM